MITGYDFSNPNDVASRTISYNAENMPVSIKRNGVETLIEYDGTGARSKKTVGGYSTLYIGDHYEVRNGVPIKYIFGGGQRIAKVVADTATYYHKDHLGSSVLLTDEAGQAVSDSASGYTPFGLDREPSGLDVKNHKFTDQEYDSEAGLYNYNARMYDPAIGVFITADTIVPNFANPQNLNRYTYCNNNPLIYTDPTGHRSWSFHRVWRRFEREVRRSWDKTRAEVSRAGRRLERHVNFNVYTEGSVGFYESPSNGLFNENYAPYAYEYLDTLFLNNEVRFAMAPLYAVNDLTKQQIEIIKEILKYEQKYGTVLTAMRFSNTWGSDDNRMGEGFNNIGIPTSHGEIDLDWYTDLRSVGANEHSVLIIYPVSKLLWNKLRGLGANPYEDIKETIAVDAIFSGKLKYSDLFPDWESK